MEYFTNAADAIADKSKGARTLRCTLSEAFKLAGIETVENFESIVSALYDEAPSEKARVFVEKVAGQIRDRGNDWIISNKIALHLEHNAEWHDAIAPVEDNRIWWLTEWQVALNA